MENLQKLHDFSKTMIGVFGKLQNLLPNEMQNKIAESFEKLEELKQTTNQTDDFLKPHNDMEGENDLFSEALKPGIGGQKRSFFRLRTRARTIPIISNGEALASVSGCLCPSCPRMAKFPKTSKSFFCKKKCQNSTNRQTSSFARWQD